MEERREGRASHSKRRGKKEAVEREGIKKPFIACWPGLALPQPFPVHCPEFGGSTTWEGWPQLGCPSEKSLQSKNRAKSKGER
jgi:hypothetical protein